MFFWSVDAQRYLKYVKAWNILWQVCFATGYWPAEWSLHIHILLLCFYTLNPLGDVQWCSVAICGLFPGVFFGSLALVLWTCEGVFPISILPKVHCHAVKVFGSKQPTARFPGSKTWAAFDPRVFTEFSSNPLVELSESLRFCPCTFHISIVVLFCWQLRGQRLLQAILAGLEFENLRCRRPESCLIGTHAFGIWSYYTVPKKNRS